MNDELNYLIKSLFSNNLDLFLKNTNSKLEINELTNNVILDYSWVIKVEKLLPYVEKIVNNPKDLILIDENVFKEEYTDLYENRFIYALVNKLYNFITKEIALIEKSSLNKDKKVVKYRANTRYNSQDIKIDLKLECENLELESKNSTKDKEKVFFFKDRIEKIRTSNFMNKMTDSTPVRSPIRKTNTLTTEEDYVKCLELWEFLERYQNEEVMHKQNIQTSNDDYEKLLNLIYYLNYSTLNSATLKTEEDFNENIIIKIFLDYIKRYDVDEKKIKKVLEKELVNTSSYKKEQIKIVIDAYHNFIFEHENRMKKALLLFK